VKGFGIRVGLGDEAVDGSLEIDNASKDTVLRFDPLATVATANRLRV
jgi:hypothetical protein